MTGLLHDHQVAAGPPGGVLGGLRAARRGPSRRGRRTPGPCARAAFRASAGCLVSAGSTRRDRTGARAGGRGPDVDATSRPSLTAWDGSSNNGMVESVSITSAPRRCEQQWRERPVEVDHPVPRVADDRVDEHHPDRTMWLGGRQLCDEPAAHRMTGEHHPLDPRWSSTWPSRRRSWPGSAPRWAGPACHRGRQRRPRPP